MAIELKKNWFHRKFRALWLSAIPTCSLWTQVDVTPRWLLNHPNFAFGRKQISDGYFLNWEWKFKFSNLTMTENVRQYLLLRLKSHGY
jgi:hypothetical protein